MAQKINKARIKNGIYKNIADLTSHIYRDDDWASVSNLLARIRKVLALISDNLELSVSVKDGGYRTSTDGMSQWKEYCLSVEDNGNKILEGHLNAHAAGTMEDPFSRYDMTVVLW